MNVFDINGWEFVILVIVAILVIGPDRMPEYAAKLAKLVKQVRAGRHGQGAVARTDGLGVRRRRLEAVRPASVRPAPHRS